MYEMSVRIRYSQVDQDGYLTLPALFDLLQDAATFHSQDLGYDIRYLKRVGCGWFVTDYQLALEGSTPYIGDRLTLKTWGYRFRGMFGMRNMLLVREDGSIYARVNSIWVYMDLRRMLPSRIPDKMIRDYGQEPAIDYPWPSRKIRPMEHFFERYEFAVNSLQLDSNGHMNNTHFVAAAWKELRADYAIGLIRVEYKKQAMRGDLLQLKMSCEPGQEKRENKIQALMTSPQGEVYCLVEFSRREEK